MNRAPWKTARCSPLELALLTLSVAAFCACSDNRPLPSYARLNRPNAVDFACTEKGELVPLSRCRPATTAELLNVSAYAFVTQSARGEIATIDLRRRTVLDTRRDIPGYTYVPAGEGPIAIVVPPNHPQQTYVANFGSRDVYVFDTRALIPPSQGSAPIQVVRLSVTMPSGAVPGAPTQMILAPDESALLLAVPELGRIVRLPITRCTEPALDCKEGWIDEAGIGSVALQGSVDRVSTATAAIAAAAAARAPQQMAARYEELCGFPRDAPPAPVPVAIDAQALTAAPHPRGLAIDAFCRPEEGPCPPRLLVADDALPLIHAIDLNSIGVGDSTAAILDPIPVGVPTRELAVTPAVPLTLDSPATGEDTHYVYAIDASDGSLLVIQDGQVLNVNSDPSARADRIALPNIDGKGPGAAATLAVLTPNYDPSGPRYLKRAPNQMLPMGESPDAYCPEPDRLVQNPLLLRGVFLAVALSDGTVRLVDVHDMTLRAADGQERCRNCPSAQIPLLVRHHLRLSTNLESVIAPILAPVVSPLAFAVAGRQFPIRLDGTSGSPDTPGLDCLSCTGLLQVFPPPAEAAAQESTAQATAAADLDRCPEQAPARLCGGNDPWAASTDLWRATYEGIIPGASGGGAVFIPPGAATDQAVAPEVAAEIDFCAAGVLGDEDVAAAFDPTGCDTPAAETPPPPGDQLVITSRLIESAGQDCALAREALDGDSKLAIAFAIRRAYRDHVIIASQASYPRAAPAPLQAIRSYEDVQRCLGGAPMGFVVRAKKAFVVVGDESGFRHRVIANSARRCVIDPAANRLHEGRAWPGCTFQNGAIAFRVRRQAPGAPVTATGAPAVSATGVQLLVRLNSPVPSAVFDAGSLGLSRASVLPTQMRYVEFSRGLYLVDMQERGLVPIPVGDAPFPTSVDATLTYN